MAITSKKERHESTRLVRSYLFFFGQMAPLGHITLHGKCYVYDLIEKNINSERNIGIIAI